MSKLSILSMKDLGESKMRSDSEVTHIPGLGVEPWHKPTITSYVPKLDPGVLKLQPNETLLQRRRRVLAEKKRIRQEDEGAVEGLQGDVDGVQIPLLGNDGVMERQAVASDQQPQRRQPQWRCEQVASPRSDHRYGKDFSLCLCSLGGRFIEAPGHGSMPIHCQALDSVDEKVCKCVAPYSTLKRYRASSRQPFLMLCDGHKDRLSRHECCPVCGLYCTQGLFYECDVNSTTVKSHRFHLHCVISGSSSGGGSSSSGGSSSGGDGGFITLHCPHCGSENMHIVRLNLDLAGKCPVFVPDPVKHNKMRKKMQFKLQNTSVSAMKGVARKQEQKHILSASDLEQVEEVLSEVKKSWKTIMRNRVKGKKCKNLLSLCNDKNLKKMGTSLVKGLNPNESCKDLEGRSAVHVSVLGNHLLTLSLLIKLQADLNVVDTYHNTPLMLAATMDNVPALNLLIYAGAVLQTRGGQGMTCLHHAAQSGSYAAASLILDTGAIPINQQDDRGWTALALAAQHSHADIVKLLLAQGADPNIADFGQGSTPLHLLAASGDTNPVPLLTSCGADLSSPDLAGDTPLHVAARCNQADMVEKLLALGTDASKRNRDGKLAVDFTATGSETWKVFHTHICLGYSLPAEKILNTDVSFGKERFAVRVVNGVDDEELPETFSYSTKLEFHESVTGATGIPHRVGTQLGCRCSSQCKEEPCRCLERSGGSHYIKPGILTPWFDFSSPPTLYECGEECFCAVACPNRVVQNGLCHRLEIFKTMTCGWSVRAMNFIPKGSFICSYVGELLSVIEVEKRRDDSYLFEVDHDESSQLCVDSQNSGNVSRFFNHQCDANLVTVKVVPATHQKNIPHVAFFTKRDLLPGDELGYDYGDTFWSIKLKQFHCRCGSSVCRYSEICMKRKRASAEEMAENRSMLTISNHYNDVSQILDSFTVDSEMDGIEECLCDIIDNLVKNF